MAQNWFASIIVRHPSIVVLVVSVLSGTCLLIPLALQTLPDFSDPQMGFETRGTLLANRKVAWRNLEEAIRPSGPLAVNPKDVLVAKAQVMKSNFTKKKHYKKTENRLKSKHFISESSHNNSRERSSSDREELQNVTNFKESKIVSSSDRIATDDGYFCGLPDERYTHVVFESVPGVNLFTYDSLLTLCQLEHELLKASSFDELCMETFWKPKRCCRPWSIADYVAYLHNRSSCLEISEQDVQKTKRLLQVCSQYYHDLQLLPDRNRKKHRQLPAECTTHDAAVFSIMNFLVSTSFLPPNQTTQLELKQTMIFLPIAASSAALPYYREIEKMKLNSNGVFAVAMDFGIKGVLFDQILIRDVWLMVAAVIFILMCIRLYTGSLLFALSVMIAITFSLAISYFVYTLVFGIRFFPFMNLLAVVMIIGIGADDSFIFCKIWKSFRGNVTDDRSLTNSMKHVAHHAYVSMFTTSSTTAVAFFASYVSSSITAVKCFCIFASVAVVTNCILMMVWLPAAFILSAKFRKNTSPFRKLFDSRFAESVWRSKEQQLMSTILHYRYVWITTFSIITLASSTIVLYYPKLQLPNEPVFQLFDSAHPFERYDTTYKTMFWFNRMEKVNDYRMPLRFVWGVLPIDNGNYLDPQVSGRLEFDTDFDMSHRDSQRWLLQFCRDVRKQPFYRSTMGPLLSNCFLESFVRWMERRCVDPIDRDTDRTPCCEKSSFPYDSTVFDTCIVKATSDLYETPSEYFSPGMAGPKFSKDNDLPRIEAIVIEYDSNSTYSMSHESMHDFFVTVETWMRQQLATAPPTMRNGWFVSDFEFYDLQHVLYEGSLTAIAVSLSLSLIVLLFATLNVVTSLLAILTITCSILNTVAVLVLLGWKLNVLESIALCTAVGLAVDFSVHYTIHYNLSPNGSDRLFAAEYALTAMGGPSFMAALTTGAAGAFMLPSIVLPYIEIGVFLVTIMSIGWIYATFFLCSLLAVAGPERRFGQFSYSTLRSFFRKSNRRLQDPKERCRFGVPSSSLLSDPDNTRSRDRNVCTLETSPPPASNTN